MKKFFFALLLGLFCSIGFSNTLPEFNVKNDIEKTIMKIPAVADNFVAVELQTKNIEKSFVAAGESNLFSFEKPLNYFTTNSKPKTKYSFIPFLEVNSWRIQLRNLNYNDKSNLNSYSINKHSYSNSITLNSIPTKELKISQSFKSSNRNLKDSNFFKEALFL